MSIYHYSYRSLEGEEKKLSEFEGKWILIVNTASQCGFTPQYESLEKIYKEKNDQLVVIGFPCNQFGKQEPGDSSEIRSFCQHRFGVTFPMSEKVNVNGPKVHPLFQYLKKELPGLLGSQSIKWNFTKFLISPIGRPIKRFAPKDKPEDILSHMN